MDLFIDHCPSLALSGTILGTGDEGFAKRGKTKEGPAAAIQPVAY